MLGLMTWTVIVKQNTHKNKSIKNVFSKLIFKKDTLNSALTVYGCFACMCLPVYSACGGQKRMSGPLNCHHVAVGTQNQVLTVATIALTHEAVSQAPAFFFWLVGLGGWFGLFFLCLGVFCGAYKYVPGVQGNEGRHQIPGTEAVNGWEAPCGCWSPGLLQDREMLSATGLLQPQLNLCILCGITFISKLSGLASEHLLYPS